MDRNGNRNENRNQNENEDGDESARGRQEESIEMVSGEEDRNVSEKT